jgi:hypothetical protein
MGTLVRATTTPLASIFGSGFLVIVPILAMAVGSYAVFAMAAVCVLAYAVGGVIRYNIRYAEPLIEGSKASHHTTLFERVSDVALVAAYAISVCLYLKIMASFLLGGLDKIWPGIDSSLTEHLVTIAVIVTIGLIGYFKGLQLLQKLEDIALWITMLIILALFAGFALYGISAIEGVGIQWPDRSTLDWWQIITIVAGTLIVVQGFETSRYLAQEFDTDTRVRSCRLSQVISTIVYIVFLALATPLMHFLSGQTEANSLILLAGKASVLLPLPLVLAAVLSQFSAAVADTIGGGGNMVEVTKQHVTSKCAYILICGAAAVLAFVPTFTILALASRAFAFYYMMQCLVAITVMKPGPRRTATGFLAAILAFITVFAVPAG